MNAASNAVELQCESCGARMGVAPDERAVRCPFCDASSVLLRPAEAGRPQPAFALGFVVERDAAAAAVRQWIRHRKMAPFGLRRAAAERIAGVYLPAYLYSATARSEFQAVIAENYRKLGLRQKPGGGTVIGSRDETEYRDLKGRHVAYVADVLVSASRNVSNPELQSVEPFDLARLRRYTPALVSGWSAEEPSRTPEDCVRSARQEAESSVALGLHGFMPGDGVRSLQHRVEFLEESIDPTLVPVWVFTFRYHPRRSPVRLLVNGQTGKVGGSVPFSWAKLGMLAAAALVALAAVVIALRALSRFPP